MFGWLRTSLGIIFPKDDNTKTSQGYLVMLSMVWSQKVSILKQGRFALSANLATSDGSFALFLEDLLSAWVKTSDILNGLSTRVESISAEDEGLPAKIISIFRLNSSKFV